MGAAARAGGVAVDGGAASRFREKGGRWRRVTNAATRFCPRARLGLSSFPMRGTLFTLMCCVCAVASAATVYKWVDENGITHYSDQPHQSAAKVDVQKQAPVGSVATKAPVADEATTPASVSPYSSCAIVSPTPDEVFLNTFSVPARLDVQPFLRGGDHVVVSLDGKPVDGLPAAATQFTLDQLDRGTHSVQAAIRDGSGKTVCSSGSVTFHVRQPSLHAPQRPRN
jgi:hypothetical protein